MAQCSKTINAIVDGGRVLAADYVEIDITEQDLKLLCENYEMQGHVCHDVYTSKKDFLPQWLRDKIYEYYRKKAEIKGITDKVAYSVAKAGANSIFGLISQKPIQPGIKETEDGTYITPEVDREQAYKNYLTRTFANVLSYQWAVWCTAYSAVNLHKLSQCVSGEWLYCDTDSMYATRWDMDKLRAYNDECIKKIHDAGYGPVTSKITGKQHNLGTAELQKHFSEFSCAGSKRYCGRDAETGELIITVSGVPKKTGAQCLQNDIHNFKYDFNFSGKITGKKMNIYHFSDIYYDENGNETGDSIDMISCDYTMTDPNEESWDVVPDEVEIQIYE